MLTNMENQLKEQGAGNRLDEVLREIPLVRKDLGYIPLVTPTSQIVGTQAVLNVLTGDRYKNISKETAGVLKGEYGATAAPVNPELQASVLDGATAITCRPADLLAPEIDTLTNELTTLAKEKKIRLADAVIDDVLTYALFPQIGLRFLENRDNPDAFEPVPTAQQPVVKTATENNAKDSVGDSNYLVNVDGVDYRVRVSDAGKLEDYHPVVQTQAVASSNTKKLPAPLSGNIFKVLVKQGQQVKKDDVIMILEAMKMETEVRVPDDGTIRQLFVKEGDSVQVGDSLLEME